MEALCTLCGLLFQVNKSQVKELAVSVLTVIHITEYGHQKTGSCFTKIRIF
eukprot:m.250019 g.250019  ORF g.250019 m.250019 type:complete len:51 (+) comp40309_c1_seq47:2039-2191(+)